MIGLLVVGSFAEVGGMRVVGFRYGAYVDNSLTVCPDQVVSQAGATITLADGRSFRLDEDPQALAGDLSRAENQVFVDVANGVVYGRFRRAYCGFDWPERSQLVTLPLIRKVLPSHGREIIAELDRTTRGKGGG